MLSGKRVVNFFIIVCTTLIVIWYLLLNYSSFKLKQSFQFTVHFRLRYYFILFRDAAMMREKQKKAAEKQAAEGGAKK